ncbi:MAG: nickel pincer cofactor biosynthesis protein LarB [Planctomycetaceae bacterium]|nr:nickel pincer cofactor biosynthesis protein LarB [Planctomycetaceae bacterium]
MDHEQLTQLCRRFVAGELESRQFLAECLAVTTAQSDEVSIDLDRFDRCGFPEVVFGQGKSDDAIRSAVRALSERNQAVLVTRVTPEQAAAVQSEFADVEHNQVARTLRLGDPPTLVGRVAVITAGTSDRPIAEEARETLDWMGIRTHGITDVGVAGPHRLAARWADLQALDAAVVIAGMEGALPSVVGGYVDCPVVAVPTSVGYGASFDGLSALLGMLNSCAANVTVVNIDAGFKAGYVAGLIAHQKHRAHSPDDDHH